MEVKSVVSGDSDSGISALMYAYQNGKAPGRYIPTIIENYTKKVNIEEHTIKLKVWQIAGQGDYDKVRPLSYANADVIIICFSLVSQDSLLNVEKIWLPEVKKFCKGAAYILVGLQSDLRDENSSEEIVTTKQGEEMKEKIGAYGYIEASVDKYSNINEVFELALRAVIAKQQKKKGCEIY
ncbi:GTP-binding protein rhoA [Histomonas meleagridis]|uniref:GTP-binding protein rhoA n=1 Tax=Histomonas meleagridis TaxID=135588 RepID=UPI00355ABF16|nr:GTP-binding protein rhoA [Histomonas meleagridis]KAH0803523.1 GTP-binding protein rhoA [Histomonas meleagridis]